tara:strand:+ start:265 stop:714 length:450 start_codon:yes stop_codon:yes gene_type:complete
VTPTKSDFETFLELALIGAICFTIGFIFFFKGEPTNVLTEPPMENFDDYPLQAWQTTDKDGGDCVKVKYRVEKKHTRLIMINNRGKRVHIQPISLSPHKDGRDRIEIYVWKLYRTEWTDRIPPGEYLIVAATDYDKSTSRNLNVEIDIE